jgi:hypothetical protein
MFTKTKIAASVAIVLGILGTASAALAGQDDRNDRGGFVVPGSMDGVNPVLHPRHFRSASKASSNAGKASERARESYGQAYVRPSPNVDPNPSTKQTGAVRPFTPFERWWFDYQSHDDQ